MALSANKILRHKESPAVLRLKLVDGLIHVFKGALLNYEAGNIGFVKLGSDTSGEEFAGIAVEEKDLAAADNATNGANDIEVWSRGCGRLVELDFTADITIANEGDGVYVDGDDKVDLAANVANSITGGFVGILRQFVSARKGWVQLTPNPHM